LINCAKFRLKTFSALSRTYPVVALDVIRAKAIKGQGKGHSVESFVSAGTTPVVVAYFTFSQTILNCMPSFFSEYAIVRRQVACVQPRKLKKSMRAYTCLYTFYLFLLFMNIITQLWAFSLFA